MATAAVTNTFVNGTPADADEVNTNFTDLVDFANNSTVHADGAVTMTGALTLPNASPTIDNHAARKKYVDDQIDAAMINDVKRQLENGYTNPFSTFTGAYQSLGTHTTSVTSGDWDACVWFHIDVSNTGGTGTAWVKFRRAFDGSTYADVYEEQFEMGTDQKRSITFPSMGDGITASGTGIKYNIQVKGTGGDITGLVASNARTLFIAYPA